MKRKTLNFVFCRVCPALIVCLLIGSESLQAQVDFATYFEPKSLRIDFALSGNARE